MSKLKVISKIFIFILLIVPLISLTSANGLQILNQTSLNLNKTFNQNQDISFTIQNQEPIKFFNITFEQTNIISLPKFDLNPGENKTVTATIVGNSDFNGSLILRGEYETTIGASNKTYEVNINYPDGLDVCNLDLISGDSINWINHVNDEVTIKNTDTNSNIHTIQSNNNYTRLFSSATEFNYQVTRLTFPFTRTCKINVQPTSGLVHSQTYDFNLPTNIKIIYEPTTLKSTFLTTSYTINYNSNTQDILKLENNGTKIAKNIHLSGNWITFNQNDFDLSPGESKNVGYTIQPQVFQTNKTNKTYNQNLKIEGNFNTISQNLTIFVPYASISSQFNDGTFDLDAFINLYNLVCQVHPEASICSRLYVNSSSSGTNITVTPEAFQSLLDKLVNLQDSYSTLSKNYQELLKNSSDTISSFESRQKNTTDKLSELKDNVNNSSDSTLLIAGIFLFVLILIILSFLWQKKGRGFRLNRKFGLHKGELNP